MSPQGGARKKRIMVVTGAVAALMIVVVVAFRDRVRERWLESQPTESLKERETAGDADRLVHLIYARRMVMDGKGEVAWPAASKAAAEIPPSAHDPESLRVLALAGYLAAQYGNESDAQDYLKRADPIRNEDTYVSLGIGVLKMRQEKWADAIEAFSNATRIAPNVTDTWSRLGTAYLASGNVEGAEQPLRRALQLNPKDAATHSDLGMVLGRQKRFAEAVQEYREATELAPDRTDYLAPYASVQASAAKTDAEFSKAEELLQSVLKQNPDDTDNRAMLAGLYIRFTKFESARRELTTLLARIPNSWDAWQNLVIVAKRLGDTGTAELAKAQFDKYVGMEVEVTNAKRNVNLHPNDARGHVRLALALGKARTDKREAMAELNKAAGLNPNDSEVKRVLGDIAEFQRKRQSGGAGTQ